MSCKIIFPVSICFWSLCNSCLAQQPKLVLPVGHTSFIDNIAYSPDDKYIVTASGYQDAKLWDAATGSLLYTLNEISAGVNKIAFSPNGQFIAATRDDYTIRIWEVKTGLIYKKVSVSELVDDFSFSPDGKKIAIVTRSNPQLKIISLTDGKSVSHYTSWKGSLYSLQWNGNSISAVCNNETIYVWDGNARLKKILTTGLNDVEKSLLSPDGNYVAVVPEDHRITLWWDIRQGSKRPGAYKGVIDSFDPSSGIASFINPDTTVTVLDISTSTVRYKFSGHRDEITSAKISPDGHHLVTTSSDTTIIIWDMKNGKPVYPVKAHDSWIINAAFSHNNKYVATCSGDKTGIIWNVETGKKLFSLKGRNAFIRLTEISRDGTLLAASDLFNQVKIWDLAEGKLLHTFKGHASLIESAHFNNDGRLFITSDNDLNVKIWDNNTGKLVQDLRGSEGTLSDAFFSNTGKFLAVVSDSLEIWSWPAKNKLFGLRERLDFSNISGKTGRIFSYDDSMVVTFNNPKGNLQITCRGVYTGKVLSTFIPQSFNGPGICKMTPEGRRLIVVHQDSLYVYDFEKRKRTHAFYRKGKTAEFTQEDIFVSPDASLAAILSERSVVEVFDLGKNISLSPFRIQDPVDKLAISFDNKLIAGNGFNMFKDKNPVFDIATGKLIRMVPGINPVYTVETGIMYTASNAMINRYDIRYDKPVMQYMPVDTTDYLVIDSLNHYDGTETARKLLYFTCGTEIIALDQVKDQLWVPNLAKRILNGDTINAKALDQLSICGLTPEVEDVKSNKEEYYFKIRPRHGGLGETVLHVNGIEVGRYKSGQLTKKGDVFYLTVKKEEVQPYFIDGQNNPVTIRSYTSGNDISSRTVIADEGETVKSNSNPPNLFAVMVGVSDYKGEEMDLTYAAKDAKDISRALAITARKLLNNDGKEHVFTYDLTTSNDYYRLPEKSGIKKTLEEIGRKATPNDILLIFFAGHGTMAGEKRQFYFLTADASKSSAVSAAADVGISMNELTEWIKPRNIKAQKRILIFDACKSGQAILDFVKMGNADQNYLASRDDERGQEIKAIEKLNEKSGLFILSASSSNQSAYEMGTIRQGVLTYSLLKAVKQQPDILQSGKYLDVSRWFNAAEKTVTELSKENGVRQQPQIVSNTNFNIGLVDAEVMAAIVLPGQKPLFTHSNLQNNDKDIAADDLGLNKLVDNNLSVISERGAASLISFIPNAITPDAYTLSGRYEIEDKKITAKVKIRNNKAVNRFEVSGTTDKLNELAAAIAGKAAELVK
jgi:WD40 repeat protein/uncharacterized caspase-like protein